MYHSPFEPEVTKGQLPAAAGFVWDKWLAFPAIYSSASNYYIATLFTVVVIHMNHAARGVAIFDFIYISLNCMLIYFSTWCPMWKEWMNENLLNNEEQISLG